MFIISFTITLQAGSDLKKKAGDTLKVSDKENMVENQIKGEAHLWCSLRADAAP